MLTVFGIALLTRAVIALALDFDAFATLENLMRLLLPPALTIAFLPFVYMLGSYIRWEDRRFQRRWRRDLAAD